MIRLFKFKTVGGALRPDLIGRPQGNRGVKPLLQLDDDAFPSHTPQAGRAIASSNAVVYRYFVSAIISLMCLSTLKAEHDYSDVAPIFDQYCVKCHGPDKQKSRYRLDTYEHLLTPGNSELDSIVPGKPLESLVVDNLQLPRDDEYAMPPEDEDQPSSEEILKIVEWISQGAKSKTAEAAILPLEENLSEDQLVSLILLRNNGAIIHKRGKNDPAVVADLQHLLRPLSGATLKALESLGSEMQELRLVGLEVTKEALEIVAGFPKLKKLDLRKTQISDDSVPTLNRIQSIEYLNLFGTQITDTGITGLKVPDKGSLFLGETGVSPNGIRLFRKEYPEVEVFGTVDLAAVVKITEVAQNNSTTFRPKSDKEKEENKESTIPEGTQVSDLGIRHSFLVCGRTTAIFNEASEVIWSTPGNARDGMVLENGNVLLSISGEAREYLKGTQEIVWSYKLDSRNKELGTANRLPNGNTLVVERGVLPRLLEVNQKGEIDIEVPLQPETDNAHMQTRMARKLPSGNYLVPHLLAFKVKEYAPSGDVVNVIATDLPELGGREAENWPFTAIRLPTGNTVVNLTHGNKTVEFAPDGTVAWECNNEDTEGRFSDPCGGQRLPNGNTVIGSYGQKDPEKVKIFEVNLDKQVVWEFFHPTIKAHEVHILTTNGKPVSPIFR